LIRSTKSTELGLKKSEIRKEKRGKKPNVSLTFPVAQIFKASDSHLKAVPAKRRARKPIKSSRKHK
jgi:hypothetical protein